MKLKLAAIILAASCLPAMAALPLPPQGNIAVISGRAHIRLGAYGTYVHVDQPGATYSVVGYIPFGDGGAFRGLYQIEGRRVAISGVVVKDGKAMIILTNRNQLMLVR